MAILMLVGRAADRLRLRPVRIGAEAIGWATGASLCEPAVIGNPGQPVAATASGGRAPGPSDIRIYRVLDDLAA
jgi:hypothetical protein